MIIVIMGYVASIVASAGLAFLFVANILQKSNSFGSEGQDPACMKRFKFLDVDQKPKM
ncbi:MAG: hypothetical protein K6E26_11710 [Clostridiales bacterium]|jgi:hypothetical protein|nr:hypothetical protein [Clostridiales bacterium]MBR6254488.1 hypothetical protein [Clostridiales bacterium]MCR5276010.1 hypothetical protein [Clostridiales bacterium]